MNSSHLIREHTAKKPPLDAARTPYFEQPTQNGDSQLAVEPFTTASPPMDWEDPRWLPCESGEFFRALSPQATSEFASLAAPFRRHENTVLFTEEQEPRAVLFLLEGRVKLSMNSAAGRRLILGIVGTGDILGLTSAVSGYPYDITAETQSPCILASVQRQAFLDFLLTYPLACRNVARQLSIEYNRAYTQLRTLGLALTATARLARLLLEWCGEGRQTERGIRFLCPLTHEEIAEHIGVSRETVSRSLHEFKTRKLLEQRGSALFVPNLHALEVYAGAAASPPVAQC
jgi:CRP/FNR family transcriptional regulator